MPTEVKNSSRGKYAEAFGRGLVMSLGQKKGTTIEMLFPTTTCKDFLNDVIWSEKTGHDASIYGFTWKKKGILDKPLYIIIQDGEKMTTDHAKILEKNLKFFAKLFGQKQGKVYFHNGHIYTKIDKGWYEHPYLFALYTLFMSSYDKNFEDLDGYYEAMRKDDVRAMYFTENGGYRFDLVINRILSKKKFTFKKYEDCVHTSTVHNGSGLVDIKQVNNIR